jgi:hypothetical protein
MLQKAFYELCQIHQPNIHKDDDGYIISIFVQTTDESIVLTTSRGSIRRFKSLDAVYEFCKEGNIRQFYVSTYELGSNSFALSLC